MGLLPGWWLSSEDFRTEGPCLTADSWDMVLRTNGFSGVEMTFPDWHSDTCQELSILVSRREEDAPVKKWSTFTATIVFDEASNVQVELKREIQKSLTIAQASKVYSLGLKDLANISSEPGQMCVIIDKEEKSLLDSLDTRTLSALNALVSLFEAVIWVTQSTKGGVKSPEFSIVDGLARVLRNENDKLRFVTVALENLQTSLPQKGQQVAQIALQTVKAETEACEKAFIEHNGVLHVQRLEPAISLSNDIHSLSQPTVSREAVWGGNTALKMTIGSPGLLDTLHFVEDTDLCKPLDDEDVEIKVCAIGVNFKDCLIALGQVSAQGLGNECAGFVTRCGSKCSFQLGDRVCMSTVESFKTYARSKMQCVYRLPDHISFTTAAAIPTQFVTAWTCLIEIARLTKGESILIHAGAGGTGQAAIQIAQYVGANIFTTVGSLQKKELLVTHYGISEDHVLYSRDTSFAIGIMRLTEGRGVNVVLNSLADESLIASWNCLAPYGRFIEIGKKDILRNSNLPMLPFNKSVTFAAFDGSIWMTERPQEAQNGIRTIIDMFARHIFQTATPLHVYNISEVDKVFRVFADGKSSGKAVVEVTEDATVPVRVPIPTL